MGGKLSLNGVYKDFDGLEVLKGVNLTVEANERHAVIGPNGAGKTTLTNIITGKFRPSAGSIVYEDRELTGLQPHELVRQGVGRSFQIINIFPEMTVFENVRNAVVARRRLEMSAFRSLLSIPGLAEEVDELLEQVGLTRLRDVQASVLPYGEQRGLEICLALATEPSLLILDEPAAGLSTAETHQVTALIERVTEGKTLILIEHDMDVVFALSDKISVLHYGTILAQGSPEEIRANPAVQESYLGKQV
ncbi:MAG: ABC transporter ATP-binding protein [Hyphomicrobiales bacterium]